MYFCSALLTVIGLTCSAAMAPPIIEHLRTQLDAQKGRVAGCTGVGIDVEHWTSLPAAAQPSAVIHRVRVATVRGIGSDNKPFHWRHVIGLTDARYWIVTERAGDNGNSEISLLGEDPETRDVRTKRFLSIRRSDAGEVVDLRDDHDHSLCATNVP